LANIVGSVKLIVPFQIRQQQKLKRFALKIQRQFSQALLMEKGMIVILFVKENNSNGAD